MLHENCNIYQGKFECAAEESKNVEFLITLVHCGLPHSAAVVEELPNWGGMHALITQSQVPVMTAGFLPVIPKLLLNMLRFTKHSSLSGRATPVVPAHSTTVL